MHRAFGCQPARVKVELFHRYFGDFEQGVMDFEISDMSNRSIFQTRKSDMRMKFPSFGRNAGFSECAVETPV